MIKLSVVVITYNEEKNIGRCLDSVQEVADEIVVVDSFSDDNTEQICLNKGAKFIQHPFQGHIQQKNYAMGLASYPHVLSLDADEVLDEELIEAIKYTKQNWDADGYEMNRLTNYCGTWIRHCGWYPDTKLRLVLKDKGSWGGSNPHDKYELEQGSRIERLSGHILHYSFTSIQEHVAQVNSFSTIMANTKYQAGKKAPIWKILFSPFHKFLKSYFLQLGVLDGYYGFIVCMISSHAIFLRYVKLRELYATTQT